MDQKPKDDIDFLEPSVLSDETLSARVRKNIEQLAALVRSYPLSNPEDDKAQDIMEKIRLKFRVIIASLGAKLEYQGRPTSSKQHVEDM